MILYPSLEELEKKIGVRFSVVMAAAKRARMLNDGAKTYFSGPETNKLSIATHELDRENVICVPAGEGYFEIPKENRKDEE